MRFKLLNQSWKHTLVWCKKSCIMSGIRELLYVIYHRAVEMWSFMKSRLELQNVISAMTCQCFQDLKENDVSKLISHLRDSMSFLQAAAKAYFIWHHLFPLKGWTPYESGIFHGQRLSFLWWPSLWCLPSHTISKFSLISVLVFFNFLTHQYSSEYIIIKAYKGKK